MPIDASSALLRLSPVGGIDLGQGGQESLERQRLTLMQQQFEETKRQNAKEEELRRMAEQGAQRRAELESQRQQEKLEADKAAAREVEKRKLMAEVQKYRDAGDIEGIEALMGSMQASGMNIERLGEDEYGLPSYQIDYDGAQAAAQEDERAAQASPYGPDETAVQSLDRLGALGYPSLSERGNLDEPNLDAPITTEDAYERGLAASQHYEETGEPLRQPDQADIMGAVPKNVIDFGAMQEQAARRLDPALGALQRAYPERYQDSVGETNDAIRGMALPANKALEQATALRAGPDAALAKELDKQDEAEPKPLTRKDVEELAKGGEARGKETFDNQDIGGSIIRTQAAKTIRELLTDKDPNNDYAIAFELPNMLGSKGPQSNKDLAVALGVDSMSTISQITDAFVRMVKGGMDEKRKKSLIEVIDRKIDQDDHMVYDFLDAIEESAGMAQDPEVARGLRDYAARNVPKVWRDAWQAARDGDDDEEGDDEEGGAPAAGARQGTTTVERPGAQYDPDAVEGSIATDDEFLEALTAEADAAQLNVDSILPLIGYESGGDPKIKNKEGSSARGLIQFLDSTAQQYTNPKTGKKFTGSEEFATLSRAEQAPFIIKYLKDRGVTSDHDQGDMYVAIAGPAALKKEDSYEVYKKGTDEYRKNLGWDLDDDGVITRGELYRYGMGERKGAKGKKASGEGKATYESPALRQQKERVAKQKSRLDNDVDAILGE